MPRLLKKSILVLAGLALAAGAGAWCWHAQSDSRVLFRTVTLRRGDVTATITASGTIEPEEVVDIGAQVAGLIKSFGTDTAGKAIDYGSVVEKDAVLATIDDSVYAADLAVAKAQL